MAFQCRKSIPNPTPSNCSGSSCHLGSQMSTSHINQWDVSPGPCIRTCLKTVMINAEELVVKHWQHCFFAERKQLHMCLGKSKSTCHGDWSDCIVASVLVRSKSKPLTYRDIYELERKSGVETSCSTQESHAVLRTFFSNSHSMLHNFATMVQSMQSRFLSNKLESDGPVQN